jgi:predicted dehydrogenase
MKIGVIGLGARAGHVINEIEKVDPSCRIAAVVDPNHQEASDSDSKVYSYYSTPEEMLHKEQLDGILIGTRCSLHTEMALKVLPSHIPLFMEKPVATTMEDLIRLKSAYEAFQSPVVVSFPLRLTNLVQLAKEIIDSGKIGTVEHAQVVNNVPYGGVYYHSWYRDEKITGGLFLQKATHDFDYVNAILGMKPTEICAMTSKQIFKGTKPAGLKCKDCEENRSCEESTAFRPDVADDWQYCSFAEDTGNEDSGSALIRYESGMHVSYSQNFFARREAGRRGARFLGYKGTLELDFITGQLQVFLHHTPRVETYDFGAGEGHFGGDTALAANFIDLMNKRVGARSLSTLEDGMQSALMCLKAKESAETGHFQRIDWS